MKQLTVPIAWQPSLYEKSWSDCSTVAAFVQISRLIFCFVSSEYPALLLDVCRVVASSRHSLTVNRAKIAGSYDVDIKTGALWFANDWLYSNSTIGNSERDLPRVQRRPKFQSIISTLSLRRRATSLPNISRGVLCLFLKPPVVAENRMQKSWRLWFCALRLVKRRTHALAGIMIGAASVQYHRSMHIEADIPRENVLTTFVLIFFFIFYSSFSLMLYYVEKKAEDWVLGWLALAVVLQKQ